MLSMSRPGCNVERYQCHMQAETWNAVNVTSRLQRGMVSMLCAGWNMECCQRYVQASLWNAVNITSRQQCWMLSMLHSGCNVKWCQRFVQAAMCERVGTWFLKSCQELFSSTWDGWTTASAAAAVLVANHLVANCLQPWRNHPNEHSAENHIPLPSPCLIIFISHFIPTLSIVAIIQLSFQAKHSRKHWDLKKPLFSCSSFLRYWQIRLAFNLSCIIHGHLMWVNIPHPLLNHTTYVVNVSHWPNTCLTWLKINIYVYQIQDCTLHKKSF